MSLRKIPAIYVIGSDGFKKQMDVIKVGAGVYRGRLQIGARQGLVPRAALSGYSGVPGSGACTGRKWNSRSMGPTRRC